MSALHNDPHPPPPALPPASPPVAAAACPIADGARAAPPLPGVRGVAGPNALLSGSLARQVSSLALPMFGEQLGTFMVGMVDTYLAGRLSKEATSAVGTATYVGWLVNVGFILVCSGVAALVSRSFGAGDRRTANRVFNQGVLMMFAIGSAISGLVWLLAPAFAAYLTQTPVARAGFIAFLRIDAFGYLAFAVLAVVNTALRASGDTRTPMAIMLLVNVVNAAVSATLVFGWLVPSLGVTGIAIGSVSARWVGGITAFVLGCAGLRGLRLRPRYPRVDWPTMRRMLRIGLPGAADNGLGNLAQFLFLGIVARTATGAAATVNFAAHVIAMRLEAISYLPAFAWGTAAATLVGQHLGAGQPDKAGRAAHAAAIQVAVLTGLVGLAFFVFPEPIYALLSNDPEVRRVGAAAFRWLGFLQPVMCVAIVYIVSLRGAGDTRYTMVVAAIAALGLRVPVAYLGGIVLGGGLLGAWSGMAADHVARLALGLTRYLQGGWRRIKV